MQITCDCCKKTYKEYPSRLKVNKSHCCSRYCAIQLRKGKSTSLKGKILVIDDREIFLDKSGNRRRGYKRNCLKCLKEFMALDFMVKQGKGLFCSYKCCSSYRDNTQFIQMVKSQTGIANPFYKHGNGYKNKTKRNIEMLTPEYKQWRKLVLTRDNHTCRKCDIKGGNLNAHHIKPWKDFPELRYVLDNGLTLCSKCHKIEHSNSSKDMVFNNQGVS